MSTRTRTRAETDSAPVRRSTPDISACEGCPGRTVLLEAGNTDGWLSSDVTVDVER